MALVGTQSCLAGCVANYYCNPLQIPGPADQQAESFAPYVKITIGDGNNEITVGNESYSTNPNTSIIKSFEIGWIDSTSMVVEVVDEAGGKFGMIVDSIHKCLNTGFYEGTSLTAEFGWVLRTCSGIPSPPLIPSPPIKATVTQVEVNYSEGKIKYKITCNCVAEPIFEERREDKNLGVEGKPMQLEDAIRQLCAMPPSVNVEFCWREADGKWKCGSHTWKGFPKGGPKAIWQSDNMNKPATITKWLEPFRVDDGTQKGKGIVVLNDTLVPDKLYIVKDLTLDPGETKTCSNINFIGTFIVNGGKCSPVISFNPTFNWIKGTANFSAGGGTNGPGSSKSRFEEDTKTPKQEKSHGAGGGLQQQLTVTQQAWHAYGPKNAWLETMKSHQAHAKAGRIVEANVESITADLIILGDPRIQFCDLTKWKGKHVSIVAINPFHIMGDANNGCGEWLANPGCNDILSNKLWRIDGINHSIKEGSFTTTLRVALNTQGIHIGIQDPLGGVGSGGPTVKNNCK